MHVVTSYPNGIFSWVDLATTDPEAAKAFYASLFGWEPLDLPTDMGTIYTMLQIDGKNVAGLGPQSPDMQSQGVPPLWSSYIKHDNVDAVAARISEAGGTVMFPPFDVMDSGRMTMALDPTGAMFGVWQPASHIGAQLVNMPNTVVWNELQARDTGAARAFYAQVFGWTYETDPNNYVLCVQDGRRHAGMIQMDESWGEVPANWAVYFMVADLAATVAKVQELGGKVLVPPMPAGEMGSFSVVQDPQGGAFTVMEMDPAFVDPPPGA